VPDRRAARGDVLLVRKTDEVNQAGLPAHFFD
jgi:hypothetical protein